MRDRFGSSLGLALSVLLSVPATDIAAWAAQPPAEKPKAAEAGEPGSAEPTCAEIVGKALTAYGGKDILQAAEGDSVVVGRQVQGGQAYSYRHVKKAGKWRTDVEPDTADTALPETKAPAGKTIDPVVQAQQGAAPAAAQPAAALPQTTAYDGAAGWQASGQEITDLPQDKLTYLNQMEERQLFLLSHWQEPGYQFALRGRTQYKQIPVFSLEVTKSDQPATTLFIDQTNYLIVGMAYELNASSGKTDNVMVDYTEYRPASSTNFPFKQAIYVNGDPLWELTVSGITCGVAIDDGLFARPNAGPVFHLAHPVTVPFDYGQKEMLVKGRINASEEMDFLVDTGASDTLIDRRVAAEHYLAKQGQFDIAAVAGVVAANSSIVKRLEVGNLVLNDLQARIIDLSPQSRMLGKPIAGIIGTNVISKFAVTIDYSKPSLVFTDPDTFQRPKNAVAVNFTQKQAPFVKVLLNGKDEQVLLVDTGAAFNHLPTAVAQKYTASDPASSHHITEGTGLDGRPVQLGRVVLDNVVIGGLPAHKVAFTYPYKAETSKGKSTPGNNGFFQDSRLGILGNPFWQNFVVTIDYKFQRLLLAPNPIVKIRADVDQALSAGDNALTLHRDYRLAESNYQRGLMVADAAHDPREQARMQGRLGNLRRIMAKDLNRPEHAKAAYTYFSRAQELAGKAKAQDVEGRILADWSLLYSDNGQTAEAKQTIDRALLLAPQDPNVNVDCAVHLYRSRLFPEMQKYVDKALFLDPSNWQALWYQVKLSENFYDTPRVVATLKEILRYYPWSKLASDKLRSLNLGPGSTSPSQAPAIVVPQQNQQKGTK